MSMRTDLTELEMSCFLSPSRKVADRFMAEQYLVDDIIKGFQLIPLAWKLAERMQEAGQYYSPRSLFGHLEIVYGYEILKQGGSSMIPACPSSSYRFLDGVVRSASITRELVPLMDELLDHREKLLSAVQEYATRALSSAGVKFVSMPFDKRLDAFFDTETHLLRSGIATRRQIQRIERIQGKPFGAYIDERLEGFIRYDKGFERVFVPSAHRKKAAESLIERIQDSAGWKQGLDREAFSRIERRHGLRSGSIWQALVNGYCLAPSGRIIEKNFKFDPLTAEVSWHPKRGKVEWETALPGVPRIRRDEICSEVLEKIREVCGNNRMVRNKLKAALVAYARTVFNESGEKVQYLGVVSKTDFQDKWDRLIQKGLVIPDKTIPEKGFVVRSPDANAIQAVARRIGLSPSQREALELAQRNFSISTFVTERGLLSSKDIVLLGNRMNNGSGGPVTLDSFIDEQLRETIRRTKDTCSANALGTVRR